MCDPLVIDYEQLQQLLGRLLAAVGVHGGPLQGLGGGTTGEALGVPLATRLLGLDGFRAAVAAARRGTAELTSVLAGVIRELDLAPQAQGGEGTYMATLLDALAGAVLAALNDAIAGVVSASSWSVAASACTLFSDTF